MCVEKEKEIESVCRGRERECVERKSVRRYRKRERKR